MSLVAIDDADVAAARALRVEFAKFWSGAQGDFRDVYDTFIGATPLAKGVTTRESTDDPAPGWWCEPVDAVPDHAILFVHGGGYGLGHAAAYRGFASQIAARAHAPVFALEYPLAPEATLGVALELAVATLAKLAARFPSVAVVGDSAGGGLSLATVLGAGRRGIPVCSLVAFSPWTDLSLGGDSVRAFAVADPLLAPDYLRASAAAYLGPAPATDPRASPLFDNLATLPPALIQVGSDEILRDDSKRFAERAQAAGRDVTLEEWQGMHHVFQLNTQQLAAARHALARTAAFLASHWKA